MPLAIYETSERLIVPTAMEPIAACTINATRGFRSPATRDPIRDAEDRMWRTRCPDRGLLLKKNRDRPQAAKVVFSTRPGQLDSRVRHNKSQANRSGRLWLDGGQELKIVHPVPIGLP